MDMGQLVLVSVITSVVLVLTVAVAWWSANPRER